MSESSQGPGWWQASDLKWYPPEQHPSVPKRGGRVIAIPVVLSLGSLAFMVLWGFAAASNCTSSPYERDCGYIDIWVYATPSTVLVITAALHRRCLNLTMAAAAVITVVSAIGLVVAA